MHRRWPRALLWLAGLVGVGAGGLAGAAEVPGTRQVGPFDITADVRRVGDSGQFLRTGNPFGTRKVRDYAVRWQGRPVELPVIGRRFWQVLHLPRSERPALLITNGPGIHLVVDTGTGLSVRPLAADSGSHGLQWLDGPGGRPSGLLIRALSLDRVEDPPTLALSEGRWLYVHRRLVLDTQTLAAVTVEPWLNVGQGAAVVNMNASNGNVLALSPGRTRFVVPGEGQDHGRGGERFDVLMLIDMASGKPEAIRLDPRATPYRHLQEIDADWIDAHFRWVPGAGGREGLVPK